MHIFHQLFYLTKIIREYSQSNLYGNFREIGRMDPRDLARDTSGTRAYSDFLIELAGRVPSQIIPNISVLLCHLNGEVRLGS